MINNNRQQQNGRRRGRGGGQRQGGGGNQGNGSRIDNRARGNAVQLLEKYKSLASDAQRQGDRVNTEYYLQFADHYFRVVSEQRGRVEEQNQPRRDGQSGFDSQFDGDEDYDGDDQGGGQQPYAQQSQQNYAPQRDSEQRDGQSSQRDGQAQQRDSQAQQRDSQPQQQGGNREREQGNRDYNRDGGQPSGNRDQPRRFDGERDGNRPPRRDRSQTDRPASETPAEGVPAVEGEPIAASEQRPRRARTPRTDAPAPVADTFDADRLPPSFAPANDGGDAVDEAEAKPRRRRLRPAAEANQPS